MERHEYFSGMPGPNGGICKGTSKFIASNGYIYEYKYDEYSEDNTSYPDSLNIQELSKNLISVATKTNKKVTDEELNLIKEYIKNIESGNEEIKEIKSSKDEEEHPAENLQYIEI